MWRIPVREKTTFPFSISQSNGNLTEMPPRVSVAPLGSLPQLLVMDPGGNFLYVMNAMSNNISVFSIDSGSWRAHGDRRVSVLGWRDAAGHADSRLRAVFSMSASRADNREHNGSIIGFSVNSGVLQSLSPPLTPAGGDKSQWTRDRSERFSSLRGKYAIEFHLYLHH